MLPMQLDGLYFYKDSLIGIQNPDVIRAG